MYRGMDVAVVVPAHNEEKHVRRVIEGMPPIVDHIIVVDDASTDATGEEARRCAGPRLEVIRLEVNQGVGGAVLTGHGRALELGADVSVVMAGDGQMDPDRLPALLDPIASGDCGFAKANRFFGPGSLQGMPARRIVGNLVVSFLTKAASGYWNLFDPLNGYTAIHRDALARLDLNSIQRRYEFENDLLIKLNIAGVRARDVPIPARYGEEHSELRLLHVVPRALGVLFRGFWSRIWWKYVLQSFSPVALFLFTGLSLLGLGGIVGIWTLLHTLGPATASAGTVVLSVAPMLTGIHFLVFALYLDIQEAQR